MSNPQSTDRDDSESRFTRAARDLAPGAFSIVMATGIVSTAAQLLGWDAVSWLLFGINIPAYLILLVLLAVRVTRHRDRARNDFRDHGRAAGFLTVIAGTAVLGTEFVLRVSLPGVASALLLIAALAWVILIYGFFAVMTVLPEKPTLDKGINASWMLIVVSTQSVSVLGTLLAGSLPAPEHVVLGVTTALFLLGCVFYLLLFSLILYRFLFFPLDPAGMSPPYWINMGAVAITTLAGSLLLLHPPGVALLDDVRPFLLGITLLFWATATWWFPLLLVLGVWRHVRRRVPIRYDIQYWSMVFPLGMYAVATLRLIAASGWTFLRPLPLVVGPFALLVWALAFGGLLRSGRATRSVTAPDGRDTRAGRH